MRAGTAVGRIALTSNWLEKIAPRAAARCCPGAPRAASGAVKAVELAPFDVTHAEPRPLGRIGGRPEWTQSPEPPECPSCERRMFFVGQLDTAALDVSVVDLFAFVCERCAIAIQVSQNT
jgi:hypothetical protein